MAIVALSHHAEDYTPFSSANKTASTQFLT
jgi:hypothetical protein